MKRFGTRSATGKMVKLKLPVDVESLLIEASNRSGRSRSFEAVIRLKDHLHRYPHVQSDRQYHTLLPVYFFLDPSWSGFMGKNKLADVCEWLHLLVVHHAGRHAGFNQVPAGL